ncbi:hypothetical protein GGF50DRAFT_101902 [Schizophyllum commune]
MHGTPSTGTPRGTPSGRGRSPRTPGHSSHSPTNSGVAQGNMAPTTSFFSCLSIPVEGAIPIDDDTSGKTPVEMPLATESKRAPRKSKMDAMAAMSASARSRSVDLDEMAANGPLAEKYYNRPPIPISPTLDLNSVKTAGQGVPAPTADPTPRPFGLQDCPEYHPTAEQFQDPMAYIQSIAEEAKQFGICKVVPPPDWKMPFVTDTETFRFKTRLQRLNSIEASARAKINFLEKLYRFHKQQGHPRVSVPTINNKALDLWTLRKEVDKLGGYEAVTKAKQWADLGRVLGYRGVPGLSTQIKNSYARIILPYEHYMARVKNSPAMSPIVANTTPGAAAPATPSKLSINTVPSASMKDESPPSSPLSAVSDNDEEEQARDTLPSASDAARTSWQERKENKGTPEQHCEICHKKNNEKQMLLCDGCDCGFHTFCLDPPLEAIPKEQWFCFACLSGTGGDYGFDEGEEHCLSSFQTRDNEFRRMWFEGHPPPADYPKGPVTNKIGNVEVPEYYLEEEFWRLVQSTQETVEVEYGADVHSATHGSAMPTLETHPLDPYSKDQWNLNNIPIVADSLLRYIKSDISGMTVPWTYVGMTFSTFCWHNEDHYTYSINFMHWGETKTWYGIPGDDAERFEAAMKREAPDLFEAQPDLLFQLVTLMNPKHVRDAGVRVYACNQRAGEFVLTFPKSYHAGFNHGLNFNEAVNFALPDWLSYDRDCVERYRRHRKMPVFSHDELLVTITQQAQTVKAAMWLLDSLKEMTDREMADRQSVRARGIKERVEAEDRPEEQYQCAVCKVFCYLSQVVCSCSPTRVVCAEHVDALCQKATSPEHLTLRLRFSDHDLYSTLATVQERSSVPAQWRQKYRSLIAETARPSLKTLKSILAEGDKMGCAVPELLTLRKCVIRAGEWLDEATHFLQRKQNRKRTKRRGRPSAAAAAQAAEDEKAEKGLDDLLQLLKEVEDMGFDTPEIAALRVLAERAATLQQRALDILQTSRGEHDQLKLIEEAKALSADASSVNVALEEVQAVERIVEREELTKELENLYGGDDPMLSMEQVRGLLSRARACGLTNENKYVEILEAKDKEGGDWEEKAQAILHAEVKTVADLELFSGADGVVPPVALNVLTRLRTLYDRAKDYEKQVGIWLGADDEVTANKPTLADVHRFIDKVEKEFKIDMVEDLKRAVKIADDLESRCKQVINHKYQPGEDDMFETISQWMTYARNHLSLFQLPYFQKLDSQLEQHRAWLREIPWYCDGHLTAHGSDLLKDVMDATRPEDDFAPADEYFTCICDSPVRPPAEGEINTAVQCDHCYARFHAECANNGGSCPFCDHHHWNGQIPRARTWHFCYLPSILLKAPALTKQYSREWRELEVIVHRVDRLSALIGQFLAYCSQPVNQRPEHIPQVRHYMRKLWRIQFVVSPNPDVSFGLDLAGLHRLLAGRPGHKTKRKRRPKFLFGQDQDRDWVDGTRCICRTLAESGKTLRIIQCVHCRRKYHGPCVFFPEGVDSKDFLCPLCCVRKNRRYAWGDVRVKPIDAQGYPRDVYVDVAKMTETHAKEQIYVKLDQPRMSTLILELIRYIPAQLPPEGMKKESGGKPSDGTPAPASGAPAPAIPSQASTPQAASAGPPPPPWQASRWAPSMQGTPPVPPPRTPLQATPSQPIARTAASPHRAQPYSGHPPMASPRLPPPPTVYPPPPADSRKRKDPETGPPGEPSAKRRATESGSPSQAQARSPSISMHVSPGHQSSPRTAYAQGPMPAQQGPPMSPRQGLPPMHMQGAQQPPPRTTLPLVPNPRAPSYPYPPPDPRMYYSQGLPNNSALPPGRSAYPVPPPVDNSRHYRHAAPPPVPRAPLPVPPYAQMPNPPPPVPPPVPPPGRYVYHDRNGAEVRVDDPAPAHMAPPPGSMPPAHHGQIAPGPSASPAQRRQGPPGQEGDGRRLPAPAEYPPQTIQWSS